MVLFAVLKKDIIGLIVLGGLSLTVGLISFINPTSLFSYASFFILSIIIHIILFDRTIKKPTFLFVIYSLLAILLYLAQYAVFPEYKGLTGLPGGVGTDDSMYFYEAVHGEAVTPYLIPINADIEPFAKILSYVVKLFPFIQVHLLDLLFFNVLAILFVVIFIEKTTYLITKDKKIAETAFKFSAICPFFLGYGLILIRDCWTATLFIASIYFLLERKYLILFLTSLLCFYIRIASGLQLLIALVFFIYYCLKSYRSGIEKKIIFAYVIIFIIFVAIVIGYPVINEYLASKKIFQNIYRRQFLEEIIGGGVAKSGETSVLYILYQQPFYIRIPSGFLFFFASPFFSLKELIQDGTFVPRNIFLVIFPFLFLFYFVNFSKAFFLLIKNKDCALKITLITFLILLLLVSQMSLQLRHKTMLMPLFYILVAYGYNRKESVGLLIGKLGVFLLVIVQAIYFLKTTL